MFEKFTPSQQELRQDDSCREGVFLNHPLCGCVDDLGLAVSLIRLTNFILFVLVIAVSL